MSDAHDQSPTHPAIHEAQELVQDSRYHDAETIVEALIAEAPTHPSVDEEALAELQQKHASFQSALDARYTSSKKLSQLLDDIDGIFES